MPCVPAASAVTGLSATTFNAAGLHPKTAGRFAEQHGLAVYDVSHRITAYQVQGELLSNGVQDNIHGMDANQRQELGGVLRETCTLLRQLPEARDLLEHRLMDGIPTDERATVHAFIDTVATGDTDKLLRELPLADNYFWRVYLEGRYTRTCCPEYLKPENFQALKGGLVDRIKTHNLTVTEFLHEAKQPISRYILLDHMDWMSSYHPAALVEEWNAILGRARYGARILLRSAHADPAFLNWVRVGPARERLQDVLIFDRELAARLHADDRVHTYAGFMIADVPR